MIYRKQTTVNTASPAQRRHLASGCTVHVSHAGRDTSAYKGYSLRAVRHCFKSVNCKLNSCNMFGVSADFFAPGTANYADNSLRLL